MRVDLETLGALMAYHYDRRERLLQFLATIPAEAFTRPMKVGWESMQGTLVHCLTVEEFWVQHGLGKQGRPTYDPAGYVDVASVAELANAVRSRTMGYLAGLAAADLGREESITYSSGTTVRFTVSEAFLHLITHDAHHRGQVVALARQLGYEPPELDLL